MVPAAAVAAVQGAGAVSPVFTASYVALWVVVVLLAVAVWASHSGCIRVYLQMKTTSAVTEAEDRSTVAAP